MSNANPRDELRNALAVGDTAQIIRLTAELVLNEAVENENRWGAAADYWKLMNNRLWLTEMVATEIGEIYALVQDFLPPETASRIGQRRVALQQKLEQFTGVSS